MSTRAGLHRGHESVGGAVCQPAGSPWMSSRRHLNAPIGGSKSKKPRCEFAKEHNGRDMLLVQTAVTIPGRPHKHLIFEGFEDTSGDCMLVPLLNPDKLAPRVTLDVKTQVVVTTWNDANTVREGGKIDEPQPDLPEDARSPLFHMDRMFKVYMEFLWMLYLSFLIDFTPGNGSLAWACLNLRMGCVLVCAHESHVEAIKERLKAMLVKAIMDDKNARFYQSPKDLGVQEPEKKKDKKKPQGKKPKGKKRPKKAESSSGGGSSKSGSSSSKSGSSSSSKKS